MEGNDAQGSNVGIAGEKIGNRWWAIGDISRTFQRPGMRVSPGCL